MIEFILSPVFLIPLALVTPYVFYGSYGLTVFELVFVFAFMVMSIPLVVKGRFQTSGLLLIYLILFAVGYFGGVFNGGRWGMPVGMPETIRFIYYVVLAVSGYTIGFRRYVSLDNVFSHPFFKIVIIGLAVLVIAYPFLDYGQRVSMLRLFFQPGSTDPLRFLSPRFPGLGVNSNLYSFMTFSVFVFVVDAYLRKKVEILYPVLTFCVIVISGSRVVISLSILSFLLLLLGRSSILSFKLSRRVARVIGALTILFVGVFYYLNFTDSGIKIMNTVTAFRSFEAVMERGGPLAEAGTRASIWETGMARVALAPILGIAYDRFYASDTEVLYFREPHNEFIALWMFTGLMGLAAHVILIGAMLWKNAGKVDTLPWFLMYLTLVFFMFFDAAFSAVRFQPLFFMLVGMNLRYLALRAEARRAA